MRHRPRILSLSIIAASTSRRHSLAHAFVRCRHDVHSAHNRILTTPATGSMTIMVDRRQHDKDLVNNSNDLESTFMLHTRFHRFRSSPQHAPHIRRVVLLSDLHMDYSANREWLSNLCIPDGEVEGVSLNAPSGKIGDRLDDEDVGDISDKNTLIIVAGDISHDLDILRWTFQTLKQKYGEVAYTPGNHELWVDRDDNTGEDAIILTDSIDKLERVLNLCLEENIRIGPVRVGGENIVHPWDTEESPSTRSNHKIDNAQPALWVIPLLSWHHPSFDTEPPIECWAGIPSARKVVADYRRTRWPSPLTMMDDSIAHFIDSLNDIILDLDCISDMEAIYAKDNVPSRILTFSHFVPRIELLPEKRYLSLPTLPRCVGSTFLENRLRRMGEKWENSETGNRDGNTSNICNYDSSNGAINNQDALHLHAFGHTHLSWDATIDGVRYVHVPLAYPREWEQRRRSLEIGTMKGENDRLPVCLWDQATVAGFPEMWLGGWWSKYYAVMARKPERNQELAPWVAKRYRRLPGGEIEAFEHVPRNGAINNIKNG